MAPPESLLSRAERRAGWLYGAGYLLYVVVMGARAWPRLSLGDWLTFMAYQTFVYGPVWPVWPLLSLLGLNPQ